MLRLKILQSYHQRQSNKLFILTKNILISLSVGFLVLVITEPFLNAQKTEVAYQQQLNAVSYANNLASRFDREVNALIFLSSGMEAYITIHSNDLDSAELQLMLQTIHRSSPLIRNFGIAKGTVLKYVQPQTGNEKAIGLDYRTLADQWPGIEKAISSEKGILAGPIDLVQGGRGFIYRKAITVEGKYWGIMSTVIDVDSIFSLSFQNLPPSDFTFAIRTKADLSTIYGDSTLFENKNNFIQSIPVFANSWEYCLETKSDSKFQMLDLLFWANRLAALLITLSLFYLLNSRVRILLNKKQYELLSKNISDVIWIYNVTSGTIIYISQSVEKASGYTQHEIVNQPLSSLFPKDSGFTLYETIGVLLNSEKLSAGSRSTSVEVLQKIKGANSVWVEISMHPQSNDYGEREIVCVTRNIEQRKLSEKAMLTTKNKLAAIVDSPLTGIAIVDEHGMVSFKNSAFDKLLGLPVEKFSDAFDCDNQLQLNNMIARICRSSRGKHEGVYSLAPSENAEPSWLHIVVTRYPTIGENDKESVLITFHNITAQKKAEEALVELNATKDRFFSIIAHDLRNPFGTILTLSQSLVNDHLSIDPHILKNYIVPIRESAQNTYKLLENLLTWARAQTGAIKYSPQPVSVFYAAQDVVQLLSNQAKAKNIDTTINVSEKLAVLADLYMFETILRNLVSNAIKFTPGGGKVHISACEVNEGSAIQVSVADTGTGIPELILKDLFHAGNNVTTSGTNDEKGTGIGLLLCADFIKTHSGKIWAENNDGAGATFNIVIKRGKMPNFEDLFENQLDS